jgi:hypothetical protein
MTVTRVPTWRRIWSKYRRSELDRRIDRKIAAAVARMLETVAQESDPWKRLRLIRVARRFY